MLKAACSERRGTAAVVARAPEQLADPGQRNFCFPLLRMTRMLATPSCSPAGNAEVRLREVSGK